MTNKNFAAFLNLVLWGTGYLYAGQKKLQGYLFLLGLVLVHFYWFSVGYEAWFTAPGILAGLGHLAISSALAYDMYK
jgi:hypothetical protein